MNTLIKRLPLFAFVLAAVFAFAFTKPTADANIQKFAMIDGAPVNITGQILNEDCTCDDAPTSVCTFEELNGVRVPNSETSGIYVPL